MTYDDIRKELANWTGFLRDLKKDISSGQTRNYPNVLNALNRLGRAIRSLEKMLNKQNDETILGKCGDVKKSIIEIQDIVSDSISKPDSYIKVTSRLNDLIDEFGALSELLEEKGRQASEKPAGNATRAKMWTCIKRIPRWVYVLVIFLAALLGIFEKFGCLEPVKTFIRNILWPK